ncbi:hypothetical protein HPP92_001926 [Vanilla planifolia]|uniref:KIB1-4 beta-propeller domain-containing protein n=1 Tax=Vanilla planifolia TaxID=51239 RepID=A0A835S5G0_VANPL|nr:hypothetical protein HPP92_001926 [Vanilla planifolia]
MAPHLKLPPYAFSVQRWSSVASSPTFLAACSQVPSRHPCFLMVDQHLSHSVIFDTSEGNWKNLHHLSHFNQTNHPNSIPVASHGGLLCFRDHVGGFSVCNPITGARRSLPCILLTGPLLAVSMTSLNKTISSSSFRIVLVTGEFSNLSFTTFNSATNRWEEEVTLARKEGYSHEEDRVFFLSKSGEVVAADMQRSPSKEFSSVLSADEKVIFFLSHSGTVVACDMAKRLFLEYPRLLPVGSEYSIDVIVSKGEMMVVVLAEFLETASLRIWRFSGGSWRQVAAMPPAISHEFYGKKADINCVGSGDVILVCLSSIEISRSVIYNVASSEWVELPKCVVEGEIKEFVSALSFEPRVEVSV